jgi:hypothetical protein
VKWNEDNAGVKVHVRDVLFKAQVQKRSSGMIVAYGMESSCLPIGRECCFLELFSYIPKSQSISSTLLFELNKLK